MYAPEKRVSLIPSWVWRAVQRSGLPAESLHDWNAMKSRLSQEDLASLVSIMDQQNRILGTLYATDLAIEPYEYLREELFDAVRLNMPSFLTRLFDAPPEGDIPYEIKDLVTEYWTVIIYPGHFSPNLSKTNTFNLCRELCIKEYNRSDFESAAKKDFFNTYLYGLTV